MFNWKTVYELNNIFSGFELHGCENYVLFLFRFFTRWETKFFEYSSKAI
jgi:hypothetical protein